MNNTDTKKRQYFWRSYTGAEVDYIEDQPLSAFEFKYNGTSLTKGSRAFEEVYHTKPKLINKDTLEVFLY